MKKRKDIPKLRIGSRGSHLALVQVQEVLALLARQKIKFDCEIEIFKTKGDRNKLTPLTASVTDDFFTDTLDKAVLNKEVHVAVHSAKDLPKKLPDGLEVFALTKPTDGTDCLVSHKKLRHLPSGARIGTSSTLRKEMLKRFFPKLKTVEIRGTIEERLQLIDQGKCDGIIVATAALKRLGLNDVIKDVCPWDGFPLQGQLAVVGRTRDKKMRDIFSKIDVRKKYGPVTLVGAGPGDPRLITVKGSQVLKKADYVFYDFLIDKALLKYASKAKKVYVGKRKGAHALSQGDLSKMLKDRAVKGKRVVRLKGGDPLIFGRGADEIDYLRSYHIHVDVVPGISSATGIPSGMGIPLTARGISSSVAFISGHNELEKKRKQQPIKIPKTDTIIFFMGLTKLPQIIQALKKSKWNTKTPAIVMSKGTMPDEKIVVGTIGNIQRLVAKERLGQPALIMVGPTVHFWKP